MDRACSTCGRDDRCIQYIGWKIWKEETTWKMYRWEDRKLGEKVWTGCI